jgi:hypothetical protein
MIDDRLLHAHNRSEFWRSVRDCVWYAAQVALMWLAWRDKGRPIYAAVGAVAALITVATALAAVKWRRELQRDQAEGRVERARAIEARLREAR